jgi:hypothetical protein
MVHSAAGPAGFGLARRPGAVDALVVVEPIGCPDAAADAPPTPFLAVYGDYIDARNQGNRLAACRATAANVAANGQPGTVLSYPDRDVFGNTHLLMQDDSSAAIAAGV